MSDSVNTRELILDILMEVTEHQGYSHIILRDVLNKYAYLSRQERAFIARSPQTAYGSDQKHPYRWPDWILASFRWATDRYK